MSDKKTAKTEILRVCAPETQDGGWLTKVELYEAINPLPFTVYSQITLARRANELEHDGLLIGRLRKGTDYMEYARVVGEPRPKAAVPKKPESFGQVRAVTVLEDGSQLVTAHVTGNLLFSEGLQVRIA